ncbi:MAG: isoprenylcysteine carboxylmethyltransferase family protein [Chlorobium sp.]|nr:isoprenylcysteine carboxylmethyltransferase family protein [Chlorobium sp.]MCF8383983.1 isoprenylcysteine carboxylmethyltransferase family protein [Chlorobium sp.]
MATFVATPVWPEHTEAAFPPGATPLRWAVIAVCWSAALLLGGLGSHHIREYLTPLPYPVDHNQLVTTGVYGLVRHPLYGSQLLAALGWAVFSTSLSHLLLLLVAVIFFSFKASKEERWLTEKHPEYADYAKKTRKFIPWIY